MNRRSILGMLKVACIITALLGLTLFLGVAPVVLRSLNVGNTMRFVIDLIYVWIIGGLSFAALWEAWKICREIGNDRSFCPENVRSLKHIARLMFVAFGMMTVGMGVVLVTGGYDGVLIGLVALGMCISLIFSLFAKALSELILIGAEIKQENDLTI